MGNTPILLHWPDGTEEVLDVAEPRTGFIDGCELGIFRAAMVREFAEPAEVDGVTIEREIWLAPPGRR